MWVSGSELPQVMVEVAISPPTPFAGCEVAKGRVRGQAFPLRRDEADHKRLKRPHIFSEVTGWGAALLLIKFGQRLGPVGPGDRKAERGETDYGTVENRPDSPGRKITETCPEGVTQVANGAVTGHSAPLPLRVRRQVTEPCGHLATVCGIEDRVHGGNFAAVAANAKCGPVWTLPWAP